MGSLFGRMVLDGEFDGTMEIVAVTDLYADPRVAPRCFYTKGWTSSPAQR